MTMQWSVDKVLDQRAVSRSTLQHKKGSRIRTMTQLDMMTIMQHCIE